MPAETIDHVDVELVAVGELDAVDTCSSPDRCAVICAEVHVDAERLDPAREQRGAGVVDLPRHQARGELDDVRLEAEVDASRARPRGRASRRRSPRPLARCVPYAMIGSRSSIVR